MAVELYAPIGAPLHIYNILVHFNWNEESHSPLTSVCTGCSPSTTPFLCKKCNGKPCGLLHRPPFDHRLTVRLDGPTTLDGAYRGRSPQLWSVATESLTQLSAMALRQQTLADPVVEKQTWQR